MLRFAIAIMGVFVVFAGCIASTPGCGAEETIKLVREIIQSELDLSVEEFSINYITMNAHDKELDAYSCSAHLMGADEESTPITFTVQRSATDHSFVVNVYFE